MSLLEGFKAEIQSFLEDTKMPPTVFGKKAVGDPNFVFDLDKEREPRAGTIDRVRKFIREAHEQHQIDEAAA